MEKINLIVKELDVGKRLDVYLSEKFPKYSRTYFQNLIDQRLVFVNNKIVNKSLVLKLGDAIEFNFPVLPEISVNILSDVDREKLGVEVLFEHKDFLIVFKPAFLNVHKPNLTSKEVTLVDWLVYHFKELKTVGIEDRPGIVHRLDKDTSGLLIVPRNNFAHKLFSDMFKNRNIEKTYLAVVQGHPPHEGSIDYKIRRDPINRHKMSYSVTQGRDALTNYTVLEYYPNASLVEIKPITGRTHQIRVHMAAINHPIIGDATYGKKSELINRQALHAYSISFIYDCQYFSFFHDIPYDMKQLIEKLKLSK